MKRLKLFTTLALITINTTLAFADVSPNDFTSLTLSSSELISTMVLNPADIPNGVSGIYMGSALTVKDNQAYFMDLLHFNQIDFNKAYVFTGIQSDSSTISNISFATKVFDYSVQFQWIGNAWEKDNSNDFNVLVGNKKMALLAGYGHKPASSEKVTEFHGTLGFGANITDWLGVYGKLLYGAGKNEENGATAKISDTVFSLGAEVRPHLIKYIDDEFTFVIMGNYFSTTVIVDGKLSKNQYNPYVIISPAYKINYKINENLTWGSQIHIPFVFSGKNTVYSYMLNGIKAEVVPEIFDVSLGIITAFPFKVLNEKDSYGDLYNYFTFGASLKIAKAAKVDLYGSLDPTNGFSLENMWQKKWSLSFSCNF